MFPREYAHFVYGVIQSGLTTAIASGIATFSALGLNMKALSAWIMSWLIAWVMMLPVVLLASPAIQRAVVKLTAPPPDRRT